MNKRQIDYLKKQINQKATKNGLFVYFVFKRIKANDLKEQTQLRIIKDLIKPQSNFYYLAKVKKGHFCAILQPNYEKLIYLKPFNKYGFARRKKLNDESIKIMMNQAQKIIVSRPTKATTTNPYKDNINADLMLAELKRTKKRIN